MKKTVYDFFLRKSIKKRSPGSDAEKVLQRKYGNVEKAKKFYLEQVKDKLYDSMIVFIEQQYMCFISTSDKDGKTNTSFRSGEKGFVSVLSSTRLIYPEYKGQGVMASLGCMSENPHIGMLFMDFENSGIGLHVNGTTKIVEVEEIQNFLSSQEFSKIKNNKPKLTQRYVLIDVDESYIHCSKHTPHFQRKEKKIIYGTDDEMLKGGDYFGVANCPTNWDL